MWNAGFGFADCRKGTVRGFKRRFWNLSHDHRGTFEKPGLVVCAVETPDQNDEIEGLVLDLPFDDHKRILDLLDVREKCGYIRKVTRAFEFGSHAEIGEVYIFCAYRDDPGISVFIRPKNGMDNTVDELQRIASTIRSAEGFSGKNVNYLLQPYNTLVRLGFADEHVDALFELCS